MASVTPEQISAAAREYLRKTNQTALVVVPGRANEETPSHENDHCSSSRFWGFSAPPHLHRSSRRPTAARRRISRCRHSTTFTLDNGVRATLVPYGRIPKVVVSIAVFAGNYNETDAEGGLADVVGTLMKEGTSTRTAKQVAEEAAGMGGDVTVTVTGERTVVAGAALSEFAPAFMSLLGDVLMNPAFPASELERIKAISSGSSPSSGPSRESWHRSRSRKSSTRASRRGGTSRPTRRCAASRWVT